MADTDTISLDWIGATLRSIQAEQRSIRDENRLIRSAVGEMATVLLQRIAAFEAIVETRTDVISVRLNGVNGRLDAQQEQLAAIRMLLEGGR